MREICFTNSRNWRDLQNTFAYGETITTNAIDGWYKFHVNRRSLFTTSKTMTLPEAFRCYNITRAPKTFWFSNILETKKIWIVNSKPCWWQIICINFWTLVYTRVFKSFAKNVGSEGFSKILLFENFGKMKLEIL